ncbi:DJ-1/PfpI family protein [Maribacter sp. 1_MG-2023]|uniref:DJ-1/PfpI family protein n=1 Tax=Maribacter sp. 1_MG-2023 TaxID=3062677 RepID=UPI0026E265B3|nr:DJ-1/PfpI family protein [Maribacter sp. 1_MG-2023]MDO6470483.1 DJ-1/PfpI family protein [Maribacter sp. 1_MG-2023]
MKFTYILPLFLIIFISCQEKKSTVEKEIITEDIRIMPELNPESYNVAFLIMDGTFNTEFTAPFDIFQHTKYREGIKAMNTFIVANTLEPITTFEGVRILPDYDYTKDDLPQIDILVVPSAEHSMDSDLKDTVMLDFIRKVDKSTLYMTSHCDGAFPLAKAGILDSVASTTFPSDVENYREMFPNLNIKDNVLFVHDGKYITSAGGAKSFEAALYLCEVLYGKEIAKSLAKGLVIDWDVEKVPHLTVQ